MAKAKSTKSKAPKPPAEAPAPPPPAPPPPSPDPPMGPIPSVASQPSNLEEAVADVKPPGPPIPVEQAAPEPLRFRVAGDGPYLYAALFDGTQVPIAPFGKVIGLLRGEPPIPKPAIPQQVPQNFIDSVLGMVADRPTITRSELVSMLGVKHSLAPVVVEIRLDRMVGMGLGRWRNTGSGTRFVRS